MNKIKINILFWNSNDLQRIKNTRMSWKYLNEFANYVKERNCGLEIQSYIFDLSETQVLDVENVIHIPFPNGTYMRSAKINKVIEYHNTGEDFIFSVFDSDIVFRPIDYDPLIYLLQKFNSNSFLVSGLDDLHNHNGLDFDNLIIDFNKIKFEPRRFTPEMGAVFFIDYKLMNHVKFDERFIEWGCEDGFLCTKLLNLGKQRVILPFSPIHIYHQILSTEAIKTEQYKKQLKILIESGYKI